jgi:Tfp pilus assembly protein PilN
MKGMLNLLPISFRRQQMVRKRVVQWTSVMSTVLALGWAWQWYDAREYRNLSQQFETLSREHGPTQRMLHQLMEMRQQLADLQQQEAVAKELNGQRNALKLLAVVGDAARATKGRLRVTKLEVNNFQASQSGSDEQNGGKTTGLLLDGLSLDDRAVGDFLEELQKSGIFTHADPLAIKEREDKSAALREYQIQCGLLN